MLSIIRCSVFKDQCLSRDHRVVLSATTFIIYHIRFHNARYFFKFFREVLFSCVPSATLVAAGIRIYHGMQKECNMQLIPNGIHGILHSFFPNSLFYAVWNFSSSSYNLLLSPKHDSKTSTNSNVLSQQRYDANPRTDSQSPSVSLP